MHLLAFSRDEVQTGRVAQGTRPSFQNLLDALGCPFMLSVVLCGPLFISGLTPPLPFTHCSYPFSWPFTFSPCPPPPFIKVLCIYYGCLGSLLLSAVAVSGGFFSLWCAGLSLWWFLLLQSAGSRHRLSGCPAACGIFLDQGLNPCPLP